MGKIICDVCGTTYSESAAQCPICGYVHPIGTHSNSVSDELTATEMQYQHVKGGRFSKSNVRKRNNERQVQQAVASAPKAPQKRENKKKKKKRNTGLVITILLLLLAIIAVLTYIAVVFFVPEIQQETEPSESVNVTEETPAITESISCTAIALESTQVLLSDLGETVLLVPTATPADTTDEFVFSSNDEAVATVDKKSGLVTAVGYGTTDIEIVCGEITVVCNVIIEEPLPEFELSTESVVLTQQGETCLIYEGVIPVFEITWSTDDNAVAAIADGIVVAVGNGTTTVYGEHDGVVKSCTVHCDFEDVEETVGETEPAADNGPYQLKNPIGYSSSDVTIRIGEKFTLILVDKDGNKVNSGVTWSVIDGSCCKVTDGEVEGVSAGMAKVVATFGGESYTCIVRVS